MLNRDYHCRFGNLVTMKWWNDLWLNEGFASYIEYKGIDAIKTGWNMVGFPFYNLVIHKISIFNPPA
jgi:glutamyl aminopeptidase